MRGLYRLVLAWVLLAASFSGAPADAATAEYTYDANGNLHSKTEDGDLWTYLYDSRDLIRLIRRNGELVASYEYDHQGRRVRRSGPDGTVRYLWDGDRIIAELDEAGRTTARYHYSGDRLAIVEHETEGRGAYLFDGLGSPVSLSRPDGTLAIRYRYDAWGEIEEQVGESANPFGFTGHLFDGITGLYYAKARYYDPLVGRFIGVDPFEGTAVEPRSQHPYLYAYANPTAFVDLDGRCAGDLQQSRLCQAITEKMAYFLAGDPLAQAERDVEIHRKVVDGRRQFRKDFGRDPLPHEAVWSDARGYLTAGFEYVSASGAALPDHVEWSVVSAGVGGRLAYAAARAGGASIGLALAAGSRQAADDAIGEVVGVSPRDIVDVTRLARRPGPSARLEASRATSATVIVEGDGLGVDFVPANAPVANPILIEEAPARLSPGAAAVPEGTGAYRDVGGHHVHAKAGFRGHATYDPRQGFSISQEFMESRNWNHQDMTRTQHRLFKELGQSGRPNSLKEHTRIAVEALQAGGATEAEARGLVALSVWSLRFQGVRTPTRIPWVDREP